MAAGKSTSIRLSLIALFIFGSVSALAEASDQDVEQAESPTGENPTTTGKPVTLELAAGMVLNYWEPGLEGNIISFDTEGLQAWWAGAGLIVAGQPVFSLRYDQPFSPSPQQDEMLAAGYHQETGYEEFVGLLDILPVTSRFMKKQSGVAAVIRALLSFRLIYTRNLFFGSATSNVDFAYFPMGSGVDAGQDPPVAYGYVDFKAGQNLNFKTEFNDFRVMVPVSDTISKKGKECILRLGYFHSRWEKPSESIFATLEGDPIIQDTRLDSEGFSGSFESGMFQKGYGWRIDGDWGILASNWTSPLDNDDYLTEDEGLNYVAFSLEGRWNIQLLKHSDSLWLTMGGRGQFRHWNVRRSTRNSEGEIVNVETVGKVDKDKLFQIYAKVRFQF